MIIFIPPDTSIIALAEIARLMNCRLACRDWRVVLEALRNE